MLNQTRSAQTKNQEEKSITALASKEDLIYLADEGNILNIVCDENSWIIDSGASFYITPHRSFFLSYRGSDFGTAQMKNQDRSNIIGIETSS